jgi:hypothetical protein
MFIETPNLRERLRELAVHHVPAGVRAAEGAFILEPRMLEHHARPGAVRLDAIAHARAEKVVDHPREDERARRYALDDLASNDETIL